MSECNIVQLKLLFLFSSHYFVFCFHRIGLLFQFIFFDVGTQQLTHEHNNINKEKNEVGFVVVLAFIVFLFLCCT